jgi:hypothetical protein
VQEETSGGGGVFEQRKKFLDSNSANFSSRFKPASMRTKIKGHKGAVREIIYIRLRATI